MYIVNSNVKQKGKCHREIWMNYDGQNFRGGREIMSSCPDREMIQGH